MHHSKKDNEAVQIMMLSFQFAVCVPCILEYMQHQISQTDFKVEYFI